MFPEQDPEPLESNAASIIAQLQYGEIGFMFTGDSPQNIENYLAESHGASLESEVLKLGHHGSDTSTSPLFLDTVEPEIAVASVGEDNRYGHPSPAVLERLKDRGIQTLDTASSGDITFYSDGRQVWFETDE